MASPANLLRLCARPTRRLQSLRAATAQKPALRRTLTTTQWRPAAAKDSDDAAKDAGEEFDQVFSNPGEFLRSYLRDDKITDEERQLASRMLEDWKNVPPNTQRQFNKLTDGITASIAPLRRPVAAKRDSFWNSEEADTDLITDEIGEDDFEEDDMMALGHAKLEEHREFREYARLAVWEMPLLSSKPAGAVVIPR